VVTAVSAFDRLVYRQIAVYAPGEATAWPSQQTIADDLGCSRFAVHRAIHRRIRAGWLEITDRRRGRRGWTYCVYALLAPFAVRRWAIERIVDRARRRRSRRVHTNPEGVGRRDGLRGAQRGREQHRRGSDAGGGGRAGPVDAAGSERGRGGS
jgi:DNA-binding transcriptional MocR family regulator